MKVLQEILKKASVEDIVLNSRGLAFYEQGHWHGPHPSADASAQALQQLSRRIAESAGTSLGLSNPSVDAFLMFEASTFFRAHVVIPPLAPEGLEITFRRLPRIESFGLSDFTADPKVLKDLKDAIRQGSSVLIAGATGSGKTSLLTALMAELGPAKRVLILEDSPELPIPNALSTKLLARTDRFGFRDGATWDLGHLVFESLRMRPDRLVLGECRGSEASAIARALRTGHAGLMTTIHAGSAALALERFSMLANERDQAPLWNIVLHISQNVRGERRIQEFLCVNSSKP